MRRVALSLASVNTWTQLSALDITGTQQIFDFFVADSPVTQESELSWNTVQT